MLNLPCVGARPVALVNCLNFGNPEHPEVMWQLSEAIDGMAEACRAFGVPVVGGNVSLYNESRGRDIDPTPVVGVLGVVDRLGAGPPGVRLVDGPPPGRRSARRSSRAWPAPAWPPTHGCAAARDAAGRSTSTPSPATAALVRDLVADGARARRPRRRRRRPGRRPRRDGRRGRRRLPRGARRRTASPSCSASRPAGVVLCVAAEALAGVVAAAEAAERVVRPRSGSPAATGSSSKDLLDVAARRATAAWRDRLPAALGHGHDPLAIRPVSSDERRSARAWLAPEPDGEEHPVEDEELGDPERPPKPARLASADGDRRPIGASVDAVDEERRQDQAEERHPPEGQHLAAEVVGVALLPDPVAVHEVGWDRRQR